MVEEVVGVVVGEELVDGVGEGWMRSWIGIGHFFGWGSEFIFLSCF